MNVYGAIALAVVPAARAYEPVLAWKGAVFARQRLVRRDRGRPELAPLFQELQEVSVRLATLALKDPAPGSTEVRRQEIARLTERKEQLEGELARKSPSFAAQQTAGRLTPDQLRDALPGEAALVDFLEYTDSQPLADRPGSSREERRLVAFVVRPGHPTRRIDLGAVAPAEALLEQWKPGLRPGASPTDPGAPVALRDRLWGPLEEALQGARLVLVSPDGLVARLSLGALPGRAPGRYLLEERALSVVAVPQLLPSLLAGAAAQPAPRKEAATASLLLIGDVDFEADPGSAPAPAGPAPTPRSAPRDRGGVAFEPLPGTKQEVEAIDRLWSSQTARAKTRLLRRAEPTEQAFRRQATGFPYLHLATHGYFAPTVAQADAKVGASPGAALGPDRSDADVTEVHPGLLSGIALTGAGRGRTPGNAEGDDGILTALEVAGLDLSSARLVVLSACETGLGRSAGGEGLLGLQRAFQVAGARAVIASQWKVDDTATVTLMSEFYRNAREKKLGALDALRQAQLTMIRQYDPLKSRLRGLKELGRDEPPAAGPPGPLPPFYWAGFVLSGDWGLLSD